MRTLDTTECNTISGANNHLFSISLLGAFGLGFAAGVTTHINTAIIGFLGTAAVATYFVMKT